MEYERLVARHKDAVYRQMVRVCGNHEDAEDVLVEALLSAYRASEQLNDPDNFRGWLATIGRRVCGKLKKREALQPILRLSALESLGVPEPASSVASQDEQIELSELKACVQLAIDSLPRDYQEVYQLREVEEIPAEEAARKLGLTVAAVKSRLHRARKHVRTALDASVCGPL